MPANITEGYYGTRIFLTRKGVVIDKFETSIKVKKVGLERFFFHLARDNPILYALLSIAITICAGWGAAVIFTLINDKYSNLFS
tara:strand:- start:13 stop:264 length:252 start_codon:yes stop_codon:yes gene_type:complete